LAILPSVLVRYQADIDAELRSLLADRDSLLYDMMRYHLGWIDQRGEPQKGSTGKAIRPTLCLLACESTGGDWHRALPAAAAVELVHNYSLIHDDIQDDDRERRHRPTVWSVWGKPQAINAGTAMRMLANTAVRRSKLPGTKQMRIQSLIDEATIRLIEGQCLDIGYEKRVDITTKEYIRMIEAKTAALMACALEVGGEVATDDEAVIASLHQFGWDLGVVFQTKDDVLGIWGKPEETGKPLWGDIKRQKKTLPVIYGMVKAAGAAKQELLRVYTYGLTGEADITLVLSILEGVGAREYAEEVIRHYSKQAEEAVRYLPISQSVKQDFLEVANFVATRTY
jgi:geranylgeranyl diphosphate synthase type I